MQKQMPQYRAILRDAWRLTLSYKQLWVWGFFASLLGSFGEYEAVGRIFKSIYLASGELNLSDSALSTLYSRIIGSAELLFDAARNVTILPPQVILVSVVFVVGGLLLLWLSFTGIIALIAETRRLARSSKISLADGFLASQKHLVMTIIIYAAGRILMSFLGLLLVLFGLLVVVDVWLGVPLLLTSFAVLVPLTFLISFTSRFAIIGMVSKGRNMYDAIMEALQLVKKHWLVTLEMAAMLMVITIVVSLFAVIALVVTAVPVVITAAVLFEAGQLGMSQIMLFIGVLLIVLPVIFATTFIGTYQWVAWTLLYNSVSRRDAVRSKVIRLAERVIPDRTIRMKIGR